ncbi:MAG: hypothetical protein LRY62_04390 [Alphaproteobacteria bacterium]|nr:hypothetical protein [Alphaproteobacteria bacterium]
MVGFVQDGIVLNEDNAGLVMTAPISRVIDPEPKFLPDFEKGQTYGIYTNLQEKDMRNAMRYAVDLEKLSNYSERFPRVFTPVREQNFFEYMNLWIVEQVMGKSKNALDLSF